MIEDSASAQSEQTPHESEPVEPATPVTAPADDISDAPGDQHTPIAFRAVRGGIWLVGSSYWSIGFGFIANILLTRLLTPTIYGEFALAVFFVTLLNPRTKLALGFAYAQESRDPSSSFGTMFRLEMALGLLGIVIAAVAAPILFTLGYSVQVVWIFVVLMLFSFLDGLLAPFNAELDRQIRFKPGSIIVSVVMPVSYIPAFWLAINGNGQYSLLAQAVTFGLLGLVAGLTYMLLRMRFLFRLCWRFESATAARLLRFGAITGLGNFVAGLVTQLDNFLVGTIAGVGSLGYYDRAYRTSQWPGLLVNNAIGRSATFTYASIKDDQARLEKAVTMVFWGTITLITPIALALAVAATDLVELLYGPLWMPTVPLLRILLVIAVLRPIWENIGALFVGIGRPQLVFSIALVQLVVLLVVGWFFAQWFGPLGVAVAVGIMLVSSLLLAQYLMWRTVRVQLASLVSAPLFAAVVVILLYVFLNQQTSVNMLPLWLRVVVKVVYAGVMYWCVLAVIQPRTTLDRMRYVLKLVRAR